MVQPKIFIYLAFSFSTINRSHCHFRNIAPVLTLLPLLPLLSLSFFFLLSFLVPFPNPYLLLQWDPHWKHYSLCSTAYPSWPSLSLQSMLRTLEEIIENDVLAFAILMLLLSFKYYKGFFFFFFFSQHLNFFFSKPIFVISYPFLLFLRLSSLWPITITLVLNSLSTSLTILSSLLTTTYLLWLDANTPLLWKKKIIQYLKVKYHIKRKKKRYR